MSRDNSSLPKLDDFIKTADPLVPFSCNTYVNEPGFRDLYVRKRKRLLDGEEIEVLDLAKLEADEPGKGAFQRLFERLRRDYPNLALYVENVDNQRFAKALPRFGFNPDPARRLLLLEVASPTFPASPAAPTF